MRRVSADENITSRCIAKWKMMNGIVNPTVAHTSWEHTEWLPMRTHNECVTQRPVILNTASHPESQQWETEPDVRTSNICGNDNHMCVMAQKLCQELVHDFGFAFISFFRICEIVFWHKLSSTEAESIAAAIAAENMMHVGCTLLELGGETKGPTPMCEDNEFTIKMINANKPTGWSRHTDVPFFAVQDWKDEGHTLMEHFPGMINLADNPTKPLGHVLHNGHVRHTMGHSQKRGWIAMQL